MVTEVESIQMDVASELLSVETLSYSAQFVRDHVWMCLGGSELCRSSRTQLHAINNDS